VVFFGENNRKICLSHEEYLFLRLMKRFITCLLITLMMVGTVGVDQTLHYCDGELIGFVMDGFKYQNQNGDDMAKTMGMDMSSHCSHCRFVHYAYHVSSFVQGTQIAVQPVLISDDWFHGFSGVLPDPLCMVLGSNEEEFGLYQSPYHSLKIPLVRGLRAPPATV
jgi:hypothetical protein